MRGGMALSSILSSLENAWPGWQAIPLVCKDVSFMLTTSKVARSLSWEVMDQAYSQVLTQWGGKALSLSYKISGQKYDWK